ncbi:MAG TPA: polymer-forming cytoskeletal protein [Candidatus Fimivivens faecavium]|nr:polymer-forming cytoskeletal protein [Candidatus Fimivivens faecavium]
MGLLSGNKRNFEPEPLRAEEPRQIPAAAERAALISASMAVSGDVSLDEPLEIYGSVNGNVASKSTVLINNGCVTGSVECESLTIRGGRVSGPVKTGLGVVLSDGGVIEGDVTARQVRIEANASIAGNLSVHELFVGDRGEICGDVVTQVLRTQDGCVLNGSIQMKKGMDDVLAALDTPEEPPIQAPVLPIEA